MDFDLTRGLRDLSDRPTLPDEVVPVADVLTQVRRRRALRTAAVGVVGTAAVVALAVAVQASPFRDEPAPPADPTPTVEPTPAPSPSPTPTSTPTAPPDQGADDQVDARPLVGFTDDGRLVELDPETGAELRQIAAGLGGDQWDGLLALDPDGSHVYVMLNPGEGRSPGIQRLSLADGSSEQVATGGNPAVSPDGSTLAFLGPRPGGEPFTSLGLTLLDLTSGATRHLPDEEWCECERVVTSPAWSPDGSQIALGLGYGGVLSDVDVVVVDLATADTLGDGRRLPTTPDPPAPEGEIRLTTRNSQAYLPDGRLAIASTVQAADADMTTTWGAGTSLELVDPTTGAVLVTAEVPAGEPRSLAVAPDGSAVVVTLRTWSEGAEPAFSLQRWDEAGGFRELARGVRSVAW